VYDPENGDYPAIRGDEALFFVFNDISDRNTVDYGEGLGLEIKAMAFAYSDTTDEDLRNTIFISYEISNLSSNNYSDTYFGLFNDMDLGYGLDDYMGFDSVNSMMYVFNGKAIDGPAEEAFDGVPPVQGAMLLNQNASKFISYVNSTHPLIGYPSTNQNYYNYLMGNKLNGSPITYGENGLNENNPPTNFMYTGYPELNSGWNELDANNPSGDRRGIFSYGPFDLNSGNKICFDIAYPYALDNTTTTPQGSLTLLRQRAQNIKTFYETQEFECGFTDVGIEEVNNSEKKYILYPNPNTGSFRISSQELIPNTRIEIYSIIGKKIYERNINSLNQEITLDFRSGVYTFRIISKQTTIKQGKIIISK
ncbi:MAG: T9SS type A sorting domain-containing protein, partial [Bacteroidales bacterium]|nr:T9SS type A sorting domain-containing protein [Bacteroidales bacterium]